MTVQRALSLCVGLTIAAGLVGCQSLGEQFGAVGLNETPSATVQEPIEAKYYPSDEPLKLGMEYFKRGSFGLAERYFRDAVEKAPRDVTAWNALAASYDRLARFDLADQAYAMAIKLGG